MASKFAHDLKIRGFNVMTHGPVPSMIRAKFQHVTTDSDPSAPAFDYGYAGERPITFVRDETGEAWSAEGHVAFDGLKFTRVTKRIPT